MQLADMTSLALLVLPYSQKYLLEAAGAIVADLPVPAAAVSLFGLVTFKDLPGAVQTTQVSPVADHHQCAQ